MTGREEFALMPEGRNTLSVRQFSDISASENYGESALKEREKECGLLAVNTGDRSYGHQRIAREKENTLGEEEKSEGRRVEARQKVYL
jgi:hypothetical protein